jgi:hypothetical protein
VAAGGAVDGLAGHVEAHGACEGVSDGVAVVADEFVAEFLAVDPCRRRRRAVEPRLHRRPAALEQHEGGVGLAQVVVPHASPALGRKKRYQPSGTCNVEPVQGTSCSVFRHPM